MFQSFNLGLQCMGALPAMLLEGKNLLLRKAALLVCSDLQENQTTVNPDIKILKEGLF